MLNFDIDHTDLDVALRDCRRLSMYLADRYAAEPVVHYSGSKGFHVSLPTADSIEPAPDNHEVAKALACRLAGEASIVIDEAVYDRVRLWRAPNSRHHRTGRHKVLINLDDLLYISADQVRRLAAEPIPYDPASPSASARLVADWHEAAAAVRGERQREVRERKREARRHAANGEARQRINPLTRTLLTDPTSIMEGERAVTVLSAAADLAEFPTIDDLVIALLTAPALDTGLPPREVDRQIRCGIEMARRQCAAEGGAL
jgi:hypothetical protein